MTQAAFMAVFEQGIASLDVNKRGEIIGDIRTHFNEGRADGLDEERLCAMLGDPAALAREYMAEDAVNRARHRPTPRSVWKAVLAASGLGALNIFLMVPLFFALYASLTAFFISGIAVTISGIFAAAVSIAAMFTALPPWINLGVPIPAAGLFLGLSVAALGGLMTLGTVKLWQLSARMTVKYVDANVNIIKGKDAQ